MSLWREIALRFGQEKIRSPERPFIAINSPPPRTLSVTHPPSVLQTNPHSLIDLPALALSSSRVAKKDVTREQAELKKAQAADFMERIGDSDRASEFDDMSVDEYVEHKGLRLTNPARKRKRREGKMANGFSKADLEDMVDNAIEVLDDACDVASSREDLANAVSSALDILRGEDEEGDDSDDSNGDDDED